MRRGDMAWLLIVLLVPFGCIECYLLDMKVDGDMTVEKVDVSRYREVDEQNNVIWVGGSTRCECLL